MRVPATAAAAKMDTMGRTDDEPTKNRPGHSAWPWLAGANLIGFAVQHLEIEGTSVLDRLVPSGAAIDSGEWWRPLTSLVVHPGGWVHLGINTALLVVTGSRTEAALGPRRFVATYLGAGSSANALRYVVGGRRGGGASAAIFAAAGAAGAAAVLRSNRRLGGSSAVTAMAAALVGGGLVLAATIGDNHVLALGLGALCGRAIDSDNHHSFGRALILTSVTAFLAMTVRSALN